jgi:hypothetical protein
MGDGVLPRYPRRRNARGVIRPKRYQPPPIFGDQVDLAFGVERGEVGVLEDLAVDRHRHALLDLAAGEPAVEL